MPNLVFQLDLSFTLLPAQYVTFKRYHGETPPSMKKAHRPENEKQMMVIEAKKSALMEFVKDCFGFTKFKDIRVR